MMYDYREVKHEAFFFRASSFLTYLYRFRSEKKSNSNFLYFLSLNFLSLLANVVKRFHDEIDLEIELFSIR